MVASDIRYGLSWIASDLGMWYAAPGFFMSVHLSLSLQGRITDVIGPRSIRLAGKEMTGKLE
jgi:hypothetical protein